MKRIILLSLPFMLLSCGTPQIDASSEEAIESSIENIRNDLPDKKKKDFEQSLMTIATSNIDIADAFQGNMDSDSYSEDLLAEVKEQIDGKNATQIIDQADSIQQAREEKQRQQALKEIKELEEKRKQAQKDRDKLNDFEILRSEFYIHEDSYSSQPVIELTVQNNTDHAISRAYFEGTYASPDREVPWVEETFNYQISGGIEPGEEQSWELAPNQFGEWGQIEEKSDAILTVEVIRIDGPNGEDLYNSEGLSEFEKERLEELKNEYSTK